MSGRGRGRGVHTSLVSFQGPWPRPGRAGMPVRMTKAEGGVYSPPASRPFPPSDSWEVFDTCLPEDDLEARAAW